MARSFAFASDQHLSHAAAVVSSPPFTLACRFYSTRPFYQALLTINDPDTNRTFQALWLDVAGSYRLEMRSSSGASSASAASATTWSTSTWHSAMGVVATNTDRRVYLDGGNKGTNSSNHPVVGLSHTQFGVNWDGVNPIYEFGGQAAELAIWNAALTDDEAAGHGTGLSPLMIRPTSLVAYWPLGGLNFRNDRDNVGNYDMSPVNSPTWADHPPVIYPGTWSIGIDHHAAVALPLINGSLLNAGLIGGDQIA